MKRFKKIIGIISIPVFLISNSVFAGNLMLNTTGGNVGIGTSTPSSTLEVKTGAATDTNLIKVGDNNKAGYITSGSSYFGIATNDGINRFSISQTNGNVGIGTSSPVTQLHVIDSSGATATGNLMVESTGGNSSIAIKSKDSTSYSYMEFFQGAAGKFEIGVTGSSDPAGGGSFYFNPTTQTGANGSALFIKSNGNVGIGTTSPDAPLEVYNSSGNTLRLGKSTNEAYLVMGGASTDYASINNISGGGFAVSTGNGTLTEKVRVSSGGNVGIGETAPIYKLDVNGTMHVSGNMLVDGTFAAASSSIPWTSVTGRPTNVSAFTNDSGYLISTGTIANATNAVTAGTANSVIWTNVSGRPTNVSSFTNDSGYLTSSGSITNSTNVYQSNNPVSGTYRILLGNSTNANGPVYNKSALYWNDTGSIIQGANISGNAATATSAGVSTNLSGAGGSYIQRTTSGTAYSSAIQIREASGGSSNNNIIYSPMLGFHWSGVVASSIRLNSSGAFEFVDNPGSSYSNIIANNIYGASFLYSSDRTLKKDIKNLNNSLDNILKLQGVSFKWKDESKNKKTNIGLIAQDVEEVFPDIVVTDANGKKAVEYGNLVAPLIEAIKEQQKQINELKDEVKNLRAAN